MSDAPATNSDIIRFVELEIVGSHSGREEEPSRARVLELLQSIESDSGEHFEFFAEFERFSLSSPSKTDFDFLALTVFSPDEACCMLAVENTWCLVNLTQQPGTLTQRLWTGTMSDIDVVQLVPPSLALAAAAAALRTRRLDQVDENYGWEEISYVHV